MISVTSPPLTLFLLYINQDSSS